MTSEMISPSKSIRTRAPSASSPKVRKLMQATPSRDTTPEKTFQRILYGIRLRSQKDIEPIHGLRCKADVVFRRAKVCVFIDGCFWHGCPRHFRPPKTNRDWWLEKVQDNRQRDRRKTRLIRKHGWIVLRYWEHDVQDENSIKISKRITRLITSRGMVNQEAIKSRGRKTVV